jgi:phosphate:Na+ symporter
VAKAIFNVTILENVASPLTIAVCHSAFSILAMALMLPCSQLLEKLSYKVIPVTEEEKNASREITIDERLMTTPAIALERCKMFTMEMAEVSIGSLVDSMKALYSISDEIAKDIRKKESLVDKYEDVIGSYLVKLNTHPLSDADTRESAKLLHIIGDLERISDHAVNIIESAEELRDKNMSFSSEAQRELGIIIAAVEEILGLSFEAYKTGDILLADRVEPLEQVIDDLKDALRSHHIDRMQAGNCSIEVGFIWSDLLTNLERVSDHCSNIAGCIIETAHHSMSLHEYLSEVKTDHKDYNDMYKEYSAKYAV